MTRVLAEALNLCNISRREERSDLLAEDNNIACQKYSPERASGVARALERETAVGTHDLDPVSWLCESV